jgi:UDP-GlcNAc3NAcA epimerase
MTILTVIGARPQFIKAGPVSRAFSQLGIREVLVHTGQHYDANMSQVFFEELELSEPHLNLAVGSGTQGEQTASMLVGLERVIIQQKPDWVVVYGDTNSTLAGALAAVKLHVPVAHIEAGLRSFNRRMPEEINRVIADSVSDLLFAPTHAACENLEREGVAAHRLKLVGDVMFDAVVMYGSISERRSSILDRLALQPQTYILVTVHRAENTDRLENLAHIMEGISNAAQRVKVIWPVHPRTRKSLASLDASLKLPPNVHLIEPVGYLDMMQLERKAAVIVTDSGGVQKEAYFCRVPCVTLRGETEWTELVTAGWNRLCPPVSGPAIAEVIKAATGSRGKLDLSYGGGQAAERIARELLHGTSSPVARTASAGGLQAV